jgi:hypothetical protein
LHKHIYNSDIRKNGGEQQNLWKIKTKKLFFIIPCSFKNLRCNELKEEITPHKNYSFFSKTKNKSTKKAEYACQKAINILDRSPRYRTVWDITD